MLAPRGGSAAWPPSPVPGSPLAPRALQCSIVHLDLISSEAVPNSIVTPFLGSLIFSFFETVVLSFFNILFWEFLSSSLSLKATDETRLRFFCTYF